MLNRGKSFLGQNKEGELKKAQPDLLDTLPFAMYTIGQLAKP